MSDDCIALLINATCRCRSAADLLRLATVESSCESGSGMPADHQLLAALIHL